MSALKTFLVSAVKVNLFMVVPLMILIGSYKAYQRTKWEGGSFLQMAHDWLGDSWQAGAFCMVFAGLVVGIANVAGRDR